MRQLSKGPEPAILLAEGANWTTEYALAFASGSQPPTRWRHPEIVDALVAETHGKCAYCEGVIADVSYPHVEHMLPKSIYPALAVEWANLTLGCGVCNINKGDYCDASAPLIQPYVDDPSRHLLFVGPALFAVLGDSLGERTVERLKLMRPALLAERIKRLQAFHNLLERWHSAQGADKSVRELIVSDALAADQEFSCCLRSYATVAGFPAALCPI